MRNLTTQHTYKTYYRIAKPITTGIAPAKTITPKTKKGKLKMNKINKKKPSAKTAKFGTPEWPCENPWTEMSTKQRKKVLALKILPNWILQLDEELADLDFRIKKLDKFIKDSRTCSSEPLNALMGEPQNTLMNAQYLSMVNYLAFLAKRVDLAVHDTLHAAWDKPEAAAV